MSRRIQKQPQLQPKEAVAKELLNTTDPQTAERLAAVQRKHLSFLEKWSVTLPYFCGVPVVQALDYELIQVLNDSYLRGMAE